MLIFLLIFGIKNVLMECYIFRFSINSIEISILINILFLGIPDIFIYVFRLAILLI
jgi:hypothetical protein